MFTEGWKGLATQAHCHMGTLEKLLGYALEFKEDKAIKTLECACLAILDELIFIISFKNDEVT